MKLGSFIFTFSISFLSIIIGIIVSRYYSSRRKIKFYIHSIYDIIDTEIFNKKKLQFYYDSKEIKSIWIVRAIIRNEGNVDIDYKQVRHPPKLYFKPTAKILDVVESYPGSNSIIFNLDENTNSIEFDIQYIRRREHLAFQVLINSENNMVYYDDIRIEEGIIDNTDIAIVNLAKSPLSQIDARTVHVFKNRWMISLLYFTLSFFCFMQAILIVSKMLFENLYFLERLLIFSPSISNLFTQLVFGVFVLLAGLFFFRKNRLGRLFSF